MRILIYGMNHAPEFTGVGRYTGEIAAHLAVQGHDVCVVTAPPHYPEWQAGEGYTAGRWSREEMDGATVYRCPLYLSRQMRGWKRALASVSFALSSAPVVLWQALCRRPQVILTLEPTLLGAPAAIIAGKLTGARLVLQVQDLEVDAAFAMGHVKGRLLADLADKFSRAMRRGFDHVVTISDRMADQITSKGVPPERVSVVRNWVDVTRIMPLGRASEFRHELGLAQDAFVVLYAGALGAKQGVGLLIQAAGRLADQRAIVFVIAGEGPMRPALQQAATSLSNLVVLPFQPEARFSEFLGLADLHLLPQEAGAADLVLPSKLGGMLASGRNILMTADRGTELADFVGDAAICTPPGDVDAMVQAIIEAANVPETSRHHETKRLALANTLSKPEGLAAIVRILAGD